MSVEHCRTLLSVTDRGDRAVVSFPPYCNLNETNARTVGSQLLALAEQPGRRELLLDLRNVDYMSSTGLGQLLALHKKLRALGGRLVLAHATPLIREIFAVTHLDGVLDLRAGEDS